MRVVRSVITNLVLDNKELEYVIKDAQMGGATDYQEWWDNEFPKIVTNCISVSSNLGEPIV